MTYYHRNYRNNRHWRRRSDRASDVWSGVFIIGIGFIVLGSVGSIAARDFQDIIGKIIVWAMIFGFVWFVLWIKRFMAGTRVPRFKHDGSSNNETQENDPLRLMDLEKSEINSEKHGCKCYMEGLTPGEQRIANILAEGLDYKEYFIFNNLTVPWIRNGSSQIDHLVVSRFGVFVIEGKDYKGWIFGTKEQESWTVSLLGGKKFHFQNPIRQNWGHVFALRELLGFVPAESLFGLVVFSDRGTIKTDPVAGVVHPGNLIASIKAHTEVVLTEDELHKVIGKLSYSCQTADISHTEHVRNISMSHSS